MAYYNIEKRLKSDGTPRYRCNVIIKEKGVITYRESKTFPKHAHAKTWGTQSDGIRSIWHSIIKCS